MGVKRSQAIPSDLESELDDFIEKSIYHLAAQHEWPWLRAYERVELKGLIREGSVAVDIDVDATAVTGTGTSFADRDILYMGGEEYRVASITDTTNLVLTDSALVTQTEADFQLYTQDYTLTTVFSPETLRIALSGKRPIRKISIDSLNAMLTNSRRHGHPEFWAHLGNASTGMPIIRFYPIPYYTEICHFRGKKTPTIPSATDDVDDFPDEMSHIIDEWAKVWMFEFHEDGRYQTAMDKAERMLNKIYDQMDGGDEFSLDPAYYGNPETFENYGFGEY